jgi:hypothetical protein
MLAHDHSPVATLALRFTYCHQKVLKSAKKCEKVSKRVTIGKSQNRKKCQKV